MADAARHTTRMDIKPVPPTAPPAPLRRIDADDEARRDRQRRENHSEPPPPDDPEHTVDTYV